MRVELRAEARRDLVEGALFYEQQRDGLGDYFTDRLFEDLGRFETEASIHATVFGLHRTVIDVVAILDCRRDPDASGGSGRSRSRRFSAAAALTVSFGPARWYRFASQTVARVAKAERCPVWSAQASRPVTPCGLLSSDRRGRLKEWNSSGTQTKGREICRSTGLRSVKQPRCSGIPWPSPSMIQGIPTTRTGT